MLPATTERVQCNTASNVNAEIRRRTEANVTRYASSDSDAIDRRLDELNTEWDIERCLETMAPTVTLAGLLLGATVDRRWLLVPMMVQGFFLQHALQGWCPPLEVLRRLGVRTTEEINEEKNALKALRGDFERVVPHSDTPQYLGRKAFQAAQA